MPFNVKVSSDESPEPLPTYPTNTMILFNRIWQPIRDRCLLFVRHSPLRKIPTSPIMIFLAGLVGVLAGYGAVLFSWLILVIQRFTVDQAFEDTTTTVIKYAILLTSPAIGLLFVSWFTRRFAPEAQGHGVPEVITAIAREDGVIRPHVSVVKIIASGLCIGTGGSIGREGPIVQIGSSLGSTAGQLFGLSSRHIKVLVAAGAAAGISATFNAPLAGVIFASEIILGSFAIESLTPIVIASVLANVVQDQVGEHGFHAAFPDIDYVYYSTWEQMPLYMLLGLICGLAAVGFTKLLYKTEDISERFIPKWWLRALVLGGIVGVAGMLYPMSSPSQSREQEDSNTTTEREFPPLFGVGYDVVGHALHLENPQNPAAIKTKERTRSKYKQKDSNDIKLISLTPSQMLAELWWLIPLAFLKPLLTSCTLAGGGSGGIFAPSLFIGATAGASFGLLCNMWIPQYSANPGVYAIIGMGAVVSGTTHGVLSAILIVYEMTDDYRIILPIMIAAGIAAVVAQMIDPESIYLKKLSRRGESIARAHDMHRVEHVMVRNVMVRDFPVVKHSDNALEIIRIARAHSDIESLPVMNEKNELIGIIRAEDLHRVLDSDMPPQLVNAEDIAMRSSSTVSPNANLLEALREFGASDLEVLPVITGHGSSKKLIGLLLRSDLMSRYREEMLRKR